jgi:outer membrane protein TolC
MFPSRPTLQLHLARLALAIGGAVPVAVIAVPAAAAAEAGARPGSFSPAVAEAVTGTMPEDFLPQLKPLLVSAMDRSPLALGPLFEIELKQFARMRADASRLPSLGGNFNYGTTQTSTSTDSSSRSRDNGFFYNFGLNQAVYHWGALKNESAIARINELLAAKSYEKAYRDIAVLVRTLYLELVLRKARVRLARANVEAANEVLKITRERVARGAAPAAEVASDELKVRAADLELGRAESDFTTVRRSLERIAGAGPIDAEAIPAELPKPAASGSLATALTAEVLRDGAKGTIEAQMHDLRIREALLRYEVEKVRLLPKFGLGAGYSLENNTNVNGNFVEQRAVARQSVSIGAGWTIFDGFTTRAQKLEAKANERLHTLRRKLELEELQDKAQELERTVKLDAVQFDLADIQRANAVESRRVTAQEAGFGKVAKSDVDRAELVVLQAEARLVESRAAYFRNWSQLVAISGHDPALKNLPVRHAREKK